MKYRVEYREDDWVRGERSWVRGERSMAEGQHIRTVLDDGSRLTVMLVRFPGTTGPGKITSATLEAIQEDRWGRRRWHPTQDLHSRDIELIAGTT